jgi:hypothetical protein
MKFKTPDMLKNVMNHVILKARKRSKREHMHRKTEREGERE